jgi:photosystem II stability/assembly factor-like uncharacterized protein
MRVRRQLLALVCSLCVVTVIGLSVSTLPDQIASAQGLDWQQQSLPSGTFYVGPISCVNTSDCWTIGTQSITTEPEFVAATTNGGATWVTQTIPSGKAYTYYNDISCVRTHCTAVGDEFIASPMEDSGGTSTPVIIGTSNGGQTWTTDNLPNTEISDLFEVSCPNTRDCWAVGLTENSLPAILATTDGGMSWVSQTLPGDLPPRLGSISCADANNCMVTAGGSIIATSDGGSTWVSENVPSGVDVGGVSCVNSMDCRGVGASTNDTDTGTVPAIVVTSDGGATWTQQTAPIGLVGSLYSVSCVDPSHCWASGAESSPGVPVMIRTWDGGRQWGTQELPKTGTNYESLLCVSIHDCWATGNGTAGPASIIATMDGGGGVPPRIEPISGSYDTYVTFQGASSGPSMYTMDLLSNHILGRQGTIPQGTISHSTWTGASHVITIKIPLGQAPVNLCAEYDQPTTCYYEEIFSGPKTQAGIATQSQPGTVTVYIGSDVTLSGQFYAVRTGDVSSTAG